MPESVISNSSEEGSNYGLKSFKGVLCKWTNYIQGWQERFVCCREGTLSYFRTKEETGYGCRGSISLARATITLHEYDPCRFDVAMNDNIWYLRSVSEEQRQQWFDVIEVNKSISPKPRKRRNTSSVSTVSSTLEEDRSAKHEELVTFKDILVKQVESLQDYFNSCVESEKDSNGNVDTRKKSELRGEVITFKATTMSMLSTFSSYLEVVDSQVEMWKIRLQKESERHMKIEEDLTSELEALRGREAMWKNKYDGLIRKENGVEDLLPMELEERFFECDEYGRHVYSNELEDKIQRYLIDSIESPEGNSWNMYSEEGTLKLFKKEGTRMVCDPLKAHDTIRGVTAKEACYLFWDHTVRKEWEGTVDYIQVIETLDKNTIVVYQTHKPVWPTAQRDCLYLTSILKIENPPPSASNRVPIDTWMVCNFSIDDHKDANVVPDCVRATADIALVCQTYNTKPDEIEMTRDSIECDYVYIACLNPGGSVPTYIINTAYKYEYPKFLRNFTQFVLDRTGKQSLNL